MKTKNIENTNISSINNSINGISSNTDSFLKKSRNFITNKDNQMKAIKVIGSVSSTILLGDLVLTIVPIVIPAKLTGLIYSQITVMFPNIINNLKYIPRNNIRKISSNLCLFTGVISVISGNNTIPGQESTNAFRSLNSKDLL